MADVWYVRAVIPNMVNQKNVHKLMVKLEKLLNTPSVDVSALIVGVNQADGDQIRVTLEKEEEDFLKRNVPEGTL